MSRIISNDRLAGDFYLMKAERPNSARMGQFYMLRAWGDYPVLSRPVSVHDADANTVSFLYRAVGKGTNIFAGLAPGDEISMQGPLGNTFPDVGGRIAFVGGGAGIAPFYLAARQLKASHADCVIDIFLGFSDVALLTDEYGRACDNLKVNVGGFVTDDVDPSAYDHILTCGPEIMMRALHDKCKHAGAANRLWVSMEKRMACGVGACLVCACRTRDGNKKVCTDGPVFAGEAAFGT